MKTESEQLFSISTKFERVAVCILCKSQTVDIKSLTKLTKTQKLPELVKKSSVNFLKLSFRQIIKQNNKKNYLLNELMHENLVMLHDFYQAFELHD